MLFAARGNTIAPQATISYLHSADKQAPIGAAPLHLPKALAHVERLKRALASSQQAAITALRQVDFLTRANAQELATRREHEAGRSAPRSPTWKLADFCLIAGPEAGAMLSGERILTAPTRFRKGAVLYRVGDSFDALYVIRFGSCKIVLLAKSGREQIAGYHMAGEIVGIDGVARAAHKCRRPRWRTWKSGGCRSTKSKVSRDSVNHSDMVCTSSCHRRANGRIRSCSCWDRCMPNNGSRSFCSTCRSGIKHSAIRRASSSCE